MAANDVYSTKVLETVAIDGELWDFFVPEPTWMDKPQKRSSTPGDCMLIHLISEVTDEPVTFAVPVSSLWHFEIFNGKYEMMIEDVCSEALEAFIDYLNHKNNPYDMDIVNAPNLFWVIPHLITFIDDHMTNKEKCKLVDFYRFLSDCLFELFFKQEVWCISHVKIREFLDIATKINKQQLMDTNDNQLVAA